MSDNADMKALADALWNYFLPKLRTVQTDAVRFFRAVVVDNPGGNRLTVQRPFETTTMTLPCLNALASASVGQQVTVFVFGSLSNAMVMGTGSLPVYDGAYPLITSQPQNVSVDAGDLASFSVSAVGTGISYAWYYRDAGGTEFVSAGVSWPDYNYYASAANNGRQQYCVITDMGGRTVQSATATLTVT